MKRHLLIAFLLIFLLFVALFFAYSTVRAPEDQGDESFVAETPFTAEFETSFLKGTRTIEGTVLVPNRCTTLASGVHVTEEGVIRVDLVREGSEGICLELPTEQPFSVTLEAPELAPVEIYVDGARIQAQQKL